MGAFLTNLFPGGGAYWLIGLLAAVVVAGGFGYYEGTAQAENKLIAAQMEMYNKGVTAQKNFDDTQFKNAKVDSDRRHVADLGREAVLKAALAKAPTLVPAVAACTVPAAAMKSLNDVATGVAAAMGAAQ